MANAAPHAHQIAPAQCNLLVRAVRRGDVMATKRMLDADPLGYLMRDQMDTVLRACRGTAPHAVALLDLFHARRNTLFRQSHHVHLDIALKHAKFDAERFLSECSAPEVETHLLSTTTTRNIPLVLGAAIKSNDQTLVLGLMGLPPVQSFLASLEASFEPCVAMPDPDEWLADAMARGMTDRQPLEWLTQAMECNMDAVVAMAAEHCPLVTADVAWVHSALFPDGATKYADLCARRDWLNDQIEAFHDAIDAENVDVVRSMLEEVPALRRSRADDNTTALMASALAPNCIELLECLLDGGTTSKAAVEALRYACHPRAAPSSIDHLWNWIESLDRDDVRRDCALWEVIIAATARGQLAAVRTLLSHVRDWRTLRARDFIMCAIITKNEAITWAVMELPAVEAYLNTLDDNGYGAIASMDVERYEDDACDCSHKGACSEVAYCRVPIGPSWVRGAFCHGQRLAVDCLEKRWPTMTRKAAFLYCYRRAEAWTVAMEVNQRYVGDVTWVHTRDAYLVQRRVLPGLDHIGRHVATYLYVFDARDEYNRIRKPRHSDDSMLFDSDDE